MIFWIKASNFAIAAIFCSIFGQLTGLMLALPGCDLADILGPERSDRLLLHFSGLMFSCASLPVLIGPIVAAAIIKEYGVEAAAYLAMGCFAMAGMLLEASVWIPNDIAKVD